MKYLLLVITIYLFGCSKLQSKPEGILIQHLKDSAYYSNSQLAYKKEKNTVKFYTYKGELRKEINLKTRIEKRYNLTSKAPYYKSSRYIKDLGAGYFSYPDAYLIPQGTKMPMGEVGTMVTAKDEYISSSKNNVGYPSFLRFNKTGQIIEFFDRKMIYDNLGYLIYEKASSYGKTYYSAKYIYGNNHLEKSIHKGQNTNDNYTKTYHFNNLNQLILVIKSKENNPISIKKYQYNEALLKSKKEYFLSDSSFSIKMTKYTYNKIKQLTEEKKYTIHPNDSISFTNILDNNYNKDIYDGYKFNLKTTLFTYKNNKLISRQKFEKHSTTTKLTWDEQFIYNNLGQLIKIQDQFGKVLQQFSYSN